MVYHAGRGNDTMTVTGGSQNTINTEDGNDILYLKSATDSTFRTDSSGYLSLVNHTEALVQDDPYYAS